MALKVFCIHDVKASRYSNMFTAVSQGVALRIFADGANDSETMVGRHPSDYTLYMIGEFCEETGKVEPLEPRVPLARAVDLIVDKYGEPRLFDVKEA